jgi:endonuclease-3
VTAPTPAARGRPKTPSGRTARATAPAKRRRAKPDPIRSWVRRLARQRPGLADDVLAGLRNVHGQPVWSRRNDPMSELVLTILSQNSADVNAERAFESLRDRYPAASDEGPLARATGDLPERPPPGWGGRGLRSAAPPDWSTVELAPLAELVETIRPGGLAPQKAPRIQAALSAVREARGDHSLEFLGEMTAADALAWLTAIPGIGRKTASVVLLFCFGTPLMPVDRHVERVAKRIGLLPPRATVDQAHDMLAALLAPDQMYEAHVNLITHGRVICTAQRPAHERCPVAERCRYVDPKAP